MVGEEGIRHCWQGGIADVLLGEEANDENNAVDARTTLFMVNSTTKVFTAVAVLQLVERGKLSLDAPIRPILTPSTRIPYSDDLSVRHLLNYSGGVPNPTPTRWFHLSSEHEDYIDHAILARVLEENPNLAFPPGEKYLYSNLGWWILGALIEEVTGQDLKSYFAENIQNPLGVAPGELSFSVPDSDSTEENGRHLFLARGHQRRFQLLTPILWFMSDRKIWDRHSEDGVWSCFAKPLYHNGKAYGGLFATAHALAEFMRDMLRPNPILLTSDTRDLMFTKQIANDGTTELGTTLGWRCGSMATAGNGRVDYLSKPGGGPGFHSNVRIYPDRRIATILLVNETQLNEGPIQELSDLVDGPFLA